MAEISFVKPASLVFQSHTAGKFTWLLPSCSLFLKREGKKKILRDLAVCKMVPIGAVQFHGATQKIFHQESESGTLETYRKLLSIHLPAEWVTPRCLGSRGTSRLGKLLEVLLVVIISFGSPLHW